MITGKKCLVAAYHAFDNVTPEHKPANWSVAQWEHGRLSTRCFFATFLGLFLSLEDLSLEERAKNLKLLTELLESTELGLTRPELGETALWEVQARPHIQAGRVELGHPLLLEFWQKKVARDGGGFPVKLMYLFQGATNELPCLVRLPGWRWDLCGDDVVVGSCGAVTGDLLVDGIELSIPSNIHMTEKNSCSGSRI